MIEDSEQILDAPAPEEKQLVYAGFWVRTGAYIIDAILLGVVDYILDLALSLQQVQSTGISLVMGLVYFGIMESSERQATLGKMAVGIKVGNASGEQISITNALGRYLSKIISGLVLFIGFMMAGWDEKHQALHDKIANTYVFYGR
jgi:uncharacterized RDD family membrane protein YckC